MPKTERMAFNELVSLISAHARYRAGLFARFLATGFGLRGASHGFGRGDEGCTGPTKGPATFEGGRQRHIRLGAGEEAGGSEEEVDPLETAEALFKSLTPEQAAIIGTMQATEQLKRLYLRAAECGEDTVAQMQRISSSVRALHSENASLKHQLASKGIGVHSGAVEASLGAHLGSRLHIAAGCADGPPGGARSATLCAQSCGTLGSHDVKGLAHATGQQLREWDAPNIPSGPVKRKRRRKPKCRTVDVTTTSC